MRRCSIVLAAAVVLAAGCEGEGRLVSDTEPAG